MSEYSVEQVREEADGCGLLTMKRLMLRAYADPLERIKADEGAVPFCRVEDVDANVSHMAQTGVKPGDPLYLHPPAQAAQVEARTIRPCRVDSRDFPTGSLVQQVIGRADACYDRFHDRPSAETMARVHACKACGKPWPDYASDTKPHDCTAEPVAQGEVVDEVARLQGVIERDRTVFCNLIAGLKRELQTREWLGNENARAAGGYRYDEPGFIREFGEAWTAIMAALNLAHSTFRDFTDCPRGDAIRTAQADAEVILAAQPRAVPTERVVDDAAPIPRHYASNIRYAACMMESSQSVLDRREAPILRKIAAMLAAAPSPGESA